MVKEDSRGALHIIPRDNTWQNVLLKGSPPPALDDKKLPRPPNAFILYRQHHHPIVKEAHPQLHNNQICKNSQAKFFSHANCFTAIILGKQWRKEDTAVKELFKRKADSLKKKHFQDHPDYQYQPRKPTEKKRRMTRRKAEAFFESSGPSASGAGTSPTQESASAEATLPVGPTFEPEFERTMGGNPVFNFGNDSLDDGNFEDMLRKFNDSVDKAPIRQIHPNIPLLDPKAPVLHSERIEAAKNDFAYYESEFDQMVSSLSNDDIDAELDRLLTNTDGLEAEWQGMSPEEQDRQYDLIYAPSYDAAFGRYQKWPERERL